MIASEACARVIATPDIRLSDAVDLRRWAIRWRVMATQERANARAYARASMLNHLGLYRLEIVL